MNKDIALQDDRTDRFAIVFAAHLTSPQSKKLTDAAFRIWMVLHAYAPKPRSDGWSTSVERLCDDTGYSRSTVFRALKNLRDSNLVQYFKRGACNHYILINPKNLNCGIYGESTGVRSDTSTGSAGDTSTGSAGDTHTDVTDMTGNLGRFLEGSLRHLLEELETWQDRDQQFWLLGDLAKFRDAAVPWNLVAIFKDQCVSAELGYPAPVFDKVLASALTEFNPTRTKGAEKRRAFLTECQEIVRAYGRQL